jgi:hypothetical protein
VHPAGTIALEGEIVAGDGVEVTSLWSGDARGIEERARWPRESSGGGGFLGFYFSVVFSGFAEALPALRVNALAEIAYQMGGFGATGVPLRVQAGLSGASGAFTVVALGGVPSEVFGPGADGEPRVRMTSGPDTGDRAPGITGSRLRDLSLLHLDDRGRLLVRAGVAPRGVPEAVARLIENAWYLVTSHGQPRLLLRASDEIEIASGVTRPANPSEIAFDSALTRIAFLTAPTESAPGAILVAELPRACRSSRCASGRPQGGR